MSESDKITRPIKPNFTATRLSDALFILIEAKVVYDAASTLAEDKAVSWVPSYTGDLEPKQYYAKEEASTLAEDKAALYKAQNEYELCVCDSITDAINLGGI